MEQYASTNVETIHSHQATPETKQIQSLESKLITLEKFVNDQNQDIQKLRREISRLKSTIDQIIGAVKTRG